MTFILGLTGGIGSGKSAASARFETHNIQIIDADIIAREVVELGSPALATIAQHFGNEILLSSGELNRAYLREIIFSCAREKKWLEELLHPLIRKTIMVRLAKLDSTYGILSSPLLFESQQHTMAQRVLVIDCDEALQMQRALRRDNVTAEQITTIMSSQLSREQRNQQADDIIRNNHSLVALYDAIDHYHHQLLEQLNIHEH